MISDTLFEAVEEIKRYRRDMPDVYGDAEVSAEIDAVVEAMDALRAKLDAPPTAEELKSFKFGSPGTETASGKGSAILSSISEGVAKGIIKGLGD